MTFTLFIVTINRSTNIQFREKKSLKKIQNRQNNNLLLGAIVYNKIFF